MMRTKWSLTIHHEDRATVRSSRKTNSTISRTCTR